MDLCNISLTNFGHYFLLDLCRYLLYISWMISCLNCYCGLKYSLCFRLLFCRLIVKIILLLTSMFNCQLLKIYYIFWYLWFFTYCLFFSYFSHLFLLTCSLLLFADYGYSFFNCTLWISDWKTLDYCEMKTRTGYFGC